jgi:hypothetical protein
MPFSMEFGRGTRRVFPRLGGEKTSPPRTNITCRLTTKCPSSVISSGEKPKTSPWRKPHPAPEVEGNLVTSIYLLAAPKDELFRPRLDPVRRCGWLAHRPRSARVLSDQVVIDGKRKNR